MTVINLPSGISINFEDASTDQIEESLTLMREEQPDLFEEPRISEEEYISGLTADEAIEYGQRRYGGEGSGKYKVCYGSCSLVECELQHI